MPATKKHPSHRARRNQTPGAATLHVVQQGEAPSLPEREWRPETLQWWADVWASPMAPEYDHSDRHGLFVLAVLMDKFWTEPSTALAGEIRQQRTPFGLTPYDRRRLEWEIDRGDAAAEKTTARRAGRGPQAADPRKALA